MVWRNVSGPTECSIRIFQATGRKVVSETSHTVNDRKLKVNAEEDTHTENKDTTSKSSHNIHWQGGDSLLPNLFSASCRVCLGNQNGKEEVNLICIYFSNLRAVSDVLLFNKSEMRICSWDGEDD